MVKLENIKNFHYMVYCGMCVANDLQYACSMHWVT